MKYIFLLATILTLSFTSPAWAEKITVMVDGMTCEACAQTLEKAFGKEESVNVVDVDFEDKLMIISTKGEQSLSDDKIRELIEWSGFDLISINRNAEETPEAEVKTETKAAEEENKTEKTEE